MRSGNLSKAARSCRLHAAQGQSHLAAATAGQQCKKQEATTTQTSYRPSLNMTLCGNRHTCGRERLGARRRRRVQQLGLLGRLVARTAVTASAA